ncbi:carboxypeptidase-like regulatory domain-containing protein [Xanthomarina sp. F2636L]|uniref:carboxypeptidase-like regulatory domain-containing protein n=1 Tax=Xanthomarina sp. F2636L TaxID=2996018 RepID=UPI00225E4571|nr:carboxypeptidase-like regulatory domain-containing protein [Xanthomarina sp. F2636L]MCX7551395.1 carboxypeptidase-like regulatory domain-containing protein [Xanthomarina sp. F2636L]
MKVVLLLSVCSAYSQNISIKGQVTDSLKSPLEYANILAIPELENKDIRFAITDSRGNFLLKLESEQQYKLTISYLGYFPKEINIITYNEDMNKDFVLVEDVSKLNEVSLTYKIPISVKKDTITYRTDAFITGEERKLRDVLKKLPGIEVDRDGNVTAQGKKITKVLVEGKTFFTGNSKLAVNNIPADAVEEVVVLDNYNEIAMLKGLQDSEDMALDIKLKEDKKKFVFGDVEAGAGIKERYLVHPKLFYYSPKTNLNFIGDLNNTGNKRFTFNDYLEFEGGFGKLIEDAGSYLNLMNSDFAKYLINQDFKSNTNQFGALNIRQAISPVTDISGYVITNNSKTETLDLTENVYLDNTTPFNETRTENNKFNTFFTIAKLTLDYEPSFKEDLAFNSFVKVSNLNSYGFINTINPTQNNTIKTQIDSKNLNIKQNVNYSLKLSQDHTGVLEATYNFQNDKPITNWLSNQQILQGLIPLEDDVFYNVFQTKKLKTHNFNGLIKDYWVLNNYNHLYMSFGTNVAFSDLYTNDEQVLTDGQVNNFSDAGFGNDFSYQFFNTFIGLEYKFQIGIATFKPALYYHFYFWNTKQFDLSYTNNKALLLPQFTTKLEFNNSEKINFKYQLNTQFPTVDQLASNFVLSSFNSVFKGNPTLANQLYHSVSLSYYKFSLFKGLSINAMLKYNKKVKQFKTVTQLQGINQYDTLILFDQPENTWSFNGAFAKKINKVRYKFRTSYSYNDFYQLLNNETNKNISKGVSSTLSLETFFKKWPNFDIGYTKEFNTYEAFNNKTKFENDIFFVNLEYDFLNDFILKMNYSLDAYKNKSVTFNNRFDNANASLFYNKEDSPWGFEIAVTNIFDTKYKQQNSFSSFLISDSKTFIMPRILMFKISYKL